MAHKSQRQKRLQAERWGRWAETIALIFLMAKGYRFVAQRVQTPYGEIDLIMRKGAMLILVEVKARITIDEALNALGSRQIKRLRTGFTWWLGQKYNDQRLLEQRMDFIAVARFSWPRHIKNIME